MPQEINALHLLQFLQLVVPEIFRYIGSLHLLLDEAVPVESFEKVTLLDLLKCELGPLLCVFA